MKITKNLGIWMNHSVAHIMALSDDSIETLIIEHEHKDASIHRSENVQHNKEQQQQEVFYKKIAEVIKNYQDVILFGPTNAKLELSNILIADHHFDRISINIENAEKMTENQKHAFVKEYFATHLYAINHSNV